jgi:hypothetical protein
VSSISLRCRRSRCGGTCPRIAESHKNPARVSPYYVEVSGITPSKEVPRSISFEVWQSNPKTLASSRPATFNGVSRTRTRNRSPDSSYLYSRNAAVLVVSTKQFNRLDVGTLRSRGTYDSSLYWPIYTSDLRSMLRDRISHCCSFERSRVLSGIFSVLVTASLGLPGPGAYSTDARIFGRRVIVSPSE